jgi:hypothetical protein
MIDTQTGQQPKRNSPQCGDQCCSSPAHFVISHFVDDVL